MSAKIIDYEEFISLREKRGPDFDFYVDRLLEGYPHVPRGFAVLAVDQWVEEKDDLGKRLWADAEEVDCIIKVGPWDTEIDRFKAKFVPCGIVFRASTLSGQNLALTFKQWSGEDENDSDSLSVWHSSTNEIIAAEQFGLRFNFERGLGEDNSELLEGVLKKPFLYAEERMGLIEGNVTARQNARNTFQFISYLLARFDLSTEARAAEVFQHIDWEDIQISDEEDFWSEIKDAREAQRLGGIEEYLEQVIWE